MNESGPRAVEPFNPPKKAQGESEMLYLHIGAGKADDNIRAAVLDGSQTNPNAPKEPIQRYDVIYCDTGLMP